MAKYDVRISERITEAFEAAEFAGARQWIFKILYGFIRNDKNNTSYLGKPANLRDIDLAGLDLSGLELARARFDGALLLETDLRSSSLGAASFKGAILERVQFDNAALEGCDFRGSEVLSIYVNDKFIRGTTAILEGKDALQWLPSSGALVSGADELNPYSGRPWYEAAREVANSLSTRLAGTHRKKGLVRGTKMRDRELANEFTDYLLKRDILNLVIRKARGGGDKVVRVAPEYRSVITDLAEQGVISNELKPFFDKYLKQDQQRTSTS